MSIFKANSILVVHLAGLGDMVLATPALNALRKLYPEAKIYLMTNSRSKDIVKGMNDIIDEIIVIDSFTDLLLNISRLRSLKFDIVINLYRLYSPKGSLKMFLLFSLLGGKIWVGRNTEFRGSFYRLGVTEFLPDSKHEVEHKLDIIRALGLRIDDVVFRVGYDKEDERFVEGELKKEGFSETDKLIGVNFATFNPARNWDSSRYAELAALFYKEMGIKVIFCAREADRGLFLEIKKRSGVPVVDFVGRLTVRQLAAFINHCSVFISPDSGPMHIAAALGVPLVAIFGEGEFSELSPFGDNTKINSILTPIKNIPAEEVFNAAKIFLKK